MRDRIVRDESSDFGLRITLEQGIITELVFEGSNADSPILQSYHQRCVGNTLREAAEHSAMYVVHAIFADANRGIHHGIDCIQMVDPVLEKAQTLLRKVLKEQGEYRNGWNFADHGLSASWQEKTDEQKQSILDGITEKYLLSKGYAKDVLRLVQIDQYGRLFYEFDGEVSVSAKPRLLMGLEHAFQHALDERLEVFLTEMKDQHKLRRL